MTPFHVVLYTSLTVIVFIVAFLIYTWFKTKAMMKHSQKHAEDLKKELKAGMRVICAGGLIGTYKGTNKDSTIATVALSNGDIIEVAYYSISSILVEK